MDEQLSEEIVSKIRQHDGPIQTFFLKKNITIPYNTESFNETLNQLLEEGIIEYTNQGLQLKSKTLQQLIDESDDIVKLYFQGITISDIASKENKKVNEIRDHILSYLNEPVTEDRYKEDFEKYKMSVRQFTSLYGETKVTYRYLNIKYQNGKEELDGMLDDSSKTVTFKEQVNQITKKSIEIDGEIVPVNPINLITYLLKTKGACIDSKTLIDEYDKFLDERHLKSIQSLAISIGTLNNISGKENNNILQDKNGLIKYYRFEKKEVLEFIDMIDLNQYANKYISSALIFKNHPELMKQYDIDNEYQLYNLLCKYNTHLGKYKMHFIRIPSIAFGKGDDFRQVERLLELSGKITTEEFYKKYEDTYGIKSSTTRSSHSVRLRKYLDGDYYDYYLPRLKGKKLEKIAIIFTKPWYPIEDAKMMFRNKLGSEADVYFNSYNLDAIGYYIGTDIVHSKKYNNASECLEDQILNQERIKISEDMLKNYGSLRNLVSRRRNSLDLIPISKEEYLSIDFLSSIGLPKSKLSSYSDDILSMLNYGQYFTLDYLRYRNYSHEIDEYGFDDIFYKSLIEVNPKVKSSRLHGIQVFVYGDKYNKNEAIESMVGFALEDMDCMDEYELSSKIKEIYGVEISQDLTSGKYSFYYNDKTMKVYRDKESFYEELRRL